MNGISCSHKFETVEPLKAETCLKDLKTLMIEDDKIKCLRYENEYLLRFLCSTDFDVSSAYARLKQFHKLLEDYPKWFSTSSPSEKTYVIDKGVRLIPGGCDKNGRLIYIFKSGRLDVSLDLLEDLLPVEDFWAEVYLSDAYSTIATKGVCVIIDVANFSWKFMKWITPHNIAMILHRLQSMPIREYRYHVVNDSLLVNGAIKIVMKFLPRHIQEAIRFHFTDFKSLHEFVDPIELPVEYGGSKTVTDDECNRKLYEKNNIISQNFRKYRTQYLEYVSQNKISKP